ncbi:MAG: porin family protein [Gammaproteobacteria bacterium]|nr:porin family protein [Gammaproteobacteria bacterium]MCW5583341.1 porin family protein [Gammaproteobacteria bacterium]
MFKKFLCINVFSAISLSTAIASSFYVGPGLTYADLESDNVSYSGISPAVYVGYGAWARNWLYLAAEIFGTAKSMNVNRGDNDKDSLFKTDYNYGVSLVPAINMDDVLIGYVRLGYIRTKFPNLDTVHGAYQLGVGMEGSITDCWSLRGEYVYTPYSSVNGVGTVRSNQVTVGLIYRFEPLLRSTENWIL